MRFTFIAFTLFAAGQAITLSKSESFAQIGGDEDKAIEAAEHAKKLLNSADTKEDFKAISHPFQTIESSVDSKITGERKTVEDAVSKVQEANSKADAAIAKAKDAVTAKGEAGEKKIEAEKVYADSVKTVEEDVKQADEQDAAIKSARDAKDKAFKAQEVATKAIEDASAQIKVAQKAKEDAETLAKDRQGLIDYAIKEAARISAGTKAAAAAISA